MILLYICKIYEWLNDRDNLKDFVWPFFTTTVGIIVSVLIAIRVFREERKIEKRREEEVDVQVKRIILDSLQGEIRNLNDLIDKLEAFIGLKPDDIHRVSKLIYNASFIDSILRIEIVTLSRVFDPFTRINSAVGVVGFVTLLNSLKNAYTQLDEEQAVFESSCKESFTAYQQHSLDLIKCIYDLDSTLIQLSNRIEKQYKDFTDKMAKVEEENRESHPNFSVKQKGTISIQTQFAKDLLEIINIRTNKALLNTKLYQNAAKVILQDIELERLFSQFGADTNSHINFLNESLETIKIYSDILNANANE